MMAQPELSDKYKYVDIPMHEYVVCDNGILEKRCVGVQRLLVAVTEE